MTTIPGLAATAVRAAGFFSATKILQQKVDFFVDRIWWQTDQPSDQMIWDRLKGLKSGKGRFEGDISCESFACKQKAIKWAQLHVIKSKICTLLFDFFVDIFIFWGLKILHSKVHKFAIKQRKSPQQSKMNQCVCKITHYV